MSDDIKELVLSLPRVLPEEKSVGEILALLELYPIELLGQRMFAEFILISKLARMFVGEYQQQFTSARIAALYARFINCRFKFPTLDCRGMPWPTNPYSWTRQTSSKSP